MPNENYCEESLKARQKDLADGQAGVMMFLAHAIAAANHADLRGAMSNLDEALSQASTMRPDLEDLVLEVERKMDEGP